MPGDKQVFGTAMNVADRYRWDSRWTEAAKEYQRALEEFPEDLAARGGLGFCYMQTKQWKQALVEYEYILERDAGNVIALSKTAELYVILGRREQAYKGYLHLAELYSQAGQGSRAEAAWQKAVQLSPGDPEPHERLAAYYAEKKDIALLIQERLAAAQGYLLHNNLTAACAQCEEVLRVDITNAQAKLLLAQMKGELRQSSSSLQQGASAAFSQAPGAPGTPPGVSSGPLAFTGAPATEMVVPGNTSGGNTSIMGNMGSAGNFGGMGNPGQAIAPGGPNGGGSASRKRITASQVTGVLRQAQTFQTQGRYNDAIDLCEQILESGFDRPDARYFLGWLYQEQQRWDDAIRQFQMLLNDPDYALSCYYALGQCYRARGDLRTATVHFDEAVDRVNLDALTAEESDQLVQLCQEAAEAHRMLGEQEQALTVYNALLGFLRSRGWNDKVAQVEFMLQQLQNAPVPPQPMTPPPSPQAGATYVMPPEMRPQPAQSSMPDAATMMFNVGSPQSIPAPPPVQPPMPPIAPAAQGQGANSIGELPDWLTGILNESEKSQPNNPVAPPAPNMGAIAAAETSMMNQIPPSPVAPPAPPAQPASTSWLTDDARAGNATRIIPPDQMLPAPPLAPPASGPLPQTYSAMAAPVQPAPPLPVQASPAELLNPIQQYSPSMRETKDGAEELLSKIAGSAGKDESLQRVAKAVLASTASLPDGLRMQVVQSMQDIQRYIEHGLLNPAIDECLRVIDMAPQYLDVHQVLCEIYVRQGKVEQAITKYAILIDTYIANGRTDDAIETYRRILQLEPNNLTYRVRLINLLSSQGNKEDLLRERTMAAESYLRLGYMDRALTELEQALQESPTSVPTRLNYALALQKLGRTQQAMTEYQRVLQVDPRNLVALVRWNILMITGTGSSRTTNLEVLTRIRWQLRGEGQRKYETVVREYQQAGEMQPNNADIHFALGQVHQQAGNFDKAVDEYQLAMRDSVVEVLARISMAHCLLTQGKPESAIQQLEQALQTVRRAPTSIDPAIWAARPREEGEEHQAPDVEISMLLAKAYRRAGKEEQMEAVLRRVKQATAYQDEVSSELAEISARQGDVDSALQEYSDLVRHYLSKRQGENALNVLNEMVRMAPQDPRAHAELAEIYVNRGLLDEGVAELRLLADIQARRGQPTEASKAICQVANIYAEMGNNEDALSNYQRSVELSPNDMDLLREVVGFCSRIGRTREATHYQTTIARHYFETQQIKESVAALQQLIAIDRTNLDAYDMLGQTYQSVGEYEQASRVYRNLAKIRPDSSIARERLATLQELRSR
ncbi:MAG: tetratricopeptide repeat protein [Chloroflexota bacterium]|nr:tetratricopeptide repeat protein [Chloroflexota bacterium]